MAETAVPRAVLGRGAPLAGAGGPGGGLAHEDAGREVCPDRVERVCRTAGAFPSWPATASMPARCTRVATPPRPRSPATGRPARPCPRPAWPTRTPPRLFGSPAKKLFATSPLSRFAGSSRFTFSNCAPAEQEQLGRVHDPDPGAAAGAAAEDQVGLPVPGHVPGRHERPAPLGLSNTNRLASGLTVGWPAVGPGEPLPVPHRHPRPAGVPGRHDQVRGAVPVHVPDGHPGPALERRVGRPAQAGQPEEAGQHGRGRRAARLAPS